MNLSVRFGNFDAFRAKLQSPQSSAGKPAGYAFGGELKGLRDDLKARPFANGTTLADLFAQMDVLNTQTRGWLGQDEVAKILGVDISQVNSAFNVFDQVGLLNVDRTPPGRCETGTNITEKGKALIQFLNNQAG